MHTRYLKFHFVDHNLIFNNFIITCICVSLQVFRLEDSRCLFTLHGHTTKITVLHADKVMILV